MFLKAYADILNKRNKKPSPEVGVTSHDLISGKTKSFFQITHVIHISTNSKNFPINKISYGCPCVIESGLKCLVTKAFNKKELK